MTLGTRLEKSVNGCPLGQDSSLDDGRHDPGRDCASCSHVFTLYPGCGLNKSQQVIKCNDNVMIRMCITVLERTVLTVRVLKKYYQIDRIRS